MRSRIAALLLVVAGLVLCTVTLASHTVGAAPAFDKVVTTFHPVMTQENVDQLRADLAVVRGGSAGLTDQALPALAAATGATPAQVQALIVQKYPAVAAGLQQLPGTLTTFDGFADLLDAQLSNFASVDAIPVDGASPTSIPPGLLGVGAALFLLGLVVLARPQGRAAPMIAVVLGLAVLGACAAASLPGKATDSAQLSKAMKPVMTRAAIDADKADLKVLAEMAMQLQNGLLPDTAEELGVTPQQLSGQLVQASPALGELFVQLPQVQGRFTALVDLLDANLGTWQTASRPSLVVLIRTLLGTALAGIAAGTLLLVRRRPQVVDVRYRVALPAGAVPEQAAAHEDRHLIR
jgi:hypothetical protein